MAWSTADPQRVEAVSENLDMVQASNEHSTDHGLIDCFPDNLAHLRYRKDENHCGVDFHQEPHSD